MFFFILVKRNQSPTELLNASPSPNGSLSKATATATSSIGSRESLGGAISERIKSYESISSISSDNARTAAAAAAAAALAQARASPLAPNDQHVHNYADHEPFYDTVPLDNGASGGGGLDGEYVYIQAGGGMGSNHLNTGTATTGSSTTSSSRDDVSNAGSTLPMSSANAGHRQPASVSIATPSAARHPYSSQTSILTTSEPESPGRSSNYVNIDYFLAHASDAPHRTSSMDSDGESDLPPLMRTISRDDGGAVPGAAAALTPNTRRRQGGGAGNAEAAASPASAMTMTANSRSTAIRHICTSIINSETLYVDFLNKMMQYMKAIRATLTTSQPVITQDEFATMFYKIDELFDLHTQFLGKLRAQLGAADAGVDICVGDTFRELAAHISVYGAFLHNYGRAIETVKKCGSNNQQFKEIVSRIVVNSQNEQSLSLEDLLHKPVARVQKNALVLQDLMAQTPPAHADYAPLRLAQQMIRNFLSEFNVVPTKSMFPVSDMGF